MATNPTVRGLVINITASNTWTQLTEGPGGSAYTVPVGASADIGYLSAVNLGANSAVVNFGVSTNSTIDDNERISINPTLATNESLIDTDVHHMKTGQALWARATGTSPNVTFTASISELVG